MALFQTSVINDYLLTLDRYEVDKAFEVFKINYSAQKISKIKTMKEEEYQDGFLRDIFVDILGYIIKPTEGYNLIREYKNKTDGKKADGAIVKEAEAIVVIELKSTKTKDLTKVTQQAFNYKNNQPGCKYVITSNFHKLRFYIDYAHEYEEFDLFFMTRERFELFYLLLNKESIFNHLPLELKDKTLFHEKKVSEHLYKDYSNFKQKLFKNICKNHPEKEQLTLFKKSQKLLDRFLFILFAEDSHLLPTNFIDRIIKRYEILKEEDHYRPLYEIFKQYFVYMNKGRKGKNSIDDIPAYNGGLFYEDKLLDSITIDDEVLIDDLRKLSIYNFSTEVDVNILGHIFEHSLNEIEDITAEIKGTVIDQSRTKRKKDGIFYTPKYITHYIVEHTIGTLCNQKKKELGIEEIEFDGSHRRKNGSLSVKGKQVYEKIQDYKKWLLNLKIIDPACGSGAFLNQALNFLILEHETIDDIIAELLDTPLRLFDVDKSILENNLFGVDINEESVEIAQLSLWLRTARRDRTLSNLNSNIKCGNSLHSSEFNWHKAFPEVMKDGGFDAIIGNPPYIKEATNKNAFNGLHGLACYQGKMDLWYFFGDLALKIIKKEKGLIGYIAPNNWITNDGASNFRNIVLEKGKIIEFIDFGDFKVFDSAGVQTMIYIMKASSENNEYSLQYSRVLDKKINHQDAQLFLDKITNESFEYFVTSLNKENNIDKPINFINEEVNLIITKIVAQSDFSLDKKEIASGIDLLQDFVNKKHKEVLADIEVEIGDGIFNLSQNEYEALNLTSKEKNLVKPFYTTKELNRHFGISQNKYWIIYTSSEFKDKEKILPYPNLKKHLDKFIPVLTSVNKPYGLHRAREERYFQGEKILSVRKCPNRPRFTFTDFDCYINRTFMVIKTDRINQKYLTGLLNSNLIAFWLKFKGKMQGQNYQIDKNPLLNLPLMNASAEIQDKIATNVEELISNNQKIIDYTNLLTKAKESNAFKREIKLEKEIEKFNSVIYKMETEINDTIYKLYNISDLEIAQIEANIKGVID